MIATSHGIWTSGGATVTLCPDLIAATCCKCHISMSGKVSRRGSWVKASRDDHRGDCFYYCPICGLIFLRAADLDIKPFKIKAHITTRLGSFYWQSVFGMRQVHTGYKEEFDVDARQLRTKMNSALHRQTSDKLTVGGHCA